ncbi:MAG: AAA family ATPase [Burkholderiales bacterium]|nr:AAA family ATPase [Burkholderiales bacterium]
MTRPTRKTTPQPLPNLRPAEIRAAWAMAALAHAHPDRVLTQSDGENTWLTLLPALSWTEHEAAALARVVRRNPSRFLDGGPMRSLPWDDPAALARALSNVPVRRRKGLLRLPKADLGLAYRQLYEQDARTVLAQLERARGELEVARAMIDDPVRRNLGHLRTLLSWDETILTLLEVSATAQQNEPFSSALANVSTWGAPLAVELAASAFHLDNAALQSALELDGFLHRCGIIDPPLQVMDLGSLFCLGDTGRRLLWARAETPAELMRCVMTEVAPGELTPADFAHLRDDFDLIVRALRRALDGRQRGVNVLLYGPAGTGKSELARLAASMVESAAFEVRIESERGDEPRRAERLQALLVAQRILSPQTRAVLVMEEAEDVFPHSEASVLAQLFGMPARSHAGSKAWINRQLETNPFPIIWISNAVEQIDPAFLRRFTYHLAMDRLPYAARTRIAEKHLGALGVSQRLAEDVAADPSLAPASIAAAARFAELVGERDAAARENHVRRQLDGYRRAVGDAPVGRRKARELPYSMELVNTRAAYGLDRIVQALARNEQGTLLFHGAPGTGKTALAAHIAERTGRRLVKRTASELLSKWVGESEKNIARLFREHADGETVLLIDEAEGLLHGRETAERGWELTQTNEFLRRIEEFEGILIVATNLLGRIDDAFLRRFQFKVEFLPMRLEQRAALFATALDLAEIPEKAKQRLARLDRITLGDFANVHRQYVLLGDTPTVPGFLAGLEAEHAAKPAKEGGPIGFLTSR